MHYGLTRIPTESRTESLKGQGTQYVASSCLDQGYIICCNKVLTRFPGHSTSVEPKESALHEDLVCRAEPKP